MPDESCRLCGGDLVIHTQCDECRKAIQKICKTCDSITRKQFHNHRVKQEHIVNVQSRQVLEIVSKNNSKRFYSNPITVISLGVIGFFLLGFTIYAYLDISQNQPSNAVMINPDNIPVPQIRYALTIPGILKNCLAYGSGESVTVTCPTQYGYVYKAILSMPKDLADQFSDSVFSIRGVSIAETSYGSVIFQYQNNQYLTNFFAN